MVEFSEQAPVGVSIIQVCSVFLRGVANFKLVCPTINRPLAEESRSLSLLHILENMNSHHLMMTIHPTLLHILYFHPLYSAITL